MYEGFAQWRVQRGADFGAEGAVYFVPTMGALHEGHGELIRRARALADAGLSSPAQVVVSVFVNPTQFNDARDFESYPVTPEDDVALATKAGADVVVLPSAGELYPNGVPSQADPVDYGALTSVLEGAHRPGHFDGVVMVVRRLFQEARPDRVFFGEKDWQQLAVIRELVKREFPEIALEPVATMRESDGLAMSSRNVRLGDRWRHKAAELARVLSWVSESGDPLAACAQALEVLREVGFEMEYLTVADGETMQYDGWRSGAMRVFAAGSLGGVRLIDNMACKG